MSEGDPNCRSGGRGREDRCSSKGWEFDLEVSAIRLGATSCSRFINEVLGPGRSWCSDDPTLLLALDVRAREPILA